MYDQKTKVLWILFWATILGRAAYDTAQAKMTEFFRGFWPQERWF